MEPTPSPLHVSRTMAPAWRLLHVSRRVILETNASSAGQVLCATYGRCVHIAEVIWARYEVLCGKARFSGDFGTVYSPEVPLCPPLCHTPATTPVPWPPRCLMVALWLPGRALGLRCGLLKAKNTRFSGISMFYFGKMDFLKAFFLKNKQWIRFIHAILLQKKVLSFCFQTFYFFSIPPTTERVV